MKRKSSRIPKSAGKAKLRFSSHMHYALVLLVILLFAWIRFRLRDFPLERDEGEYAYMGQLLLQGISPYSTAYNMKLPGTYASYASIMALFGQTTAGIHIGFLLINAATTLFVYLLGRRLFGRCAGVIACASYALLSTSPSVLGISAHATHFVVLPALAGLLLLMKANETGRIWRFAASGFLAGLAFIMKQPGIFFVLFGGAYLLYLELRRQNRDWKRFVAREAAFILGAAVPFGLTCLALYSAGAFHKFWFWTFSYAQAYANRTSLAEGIRFFSLSSSSVVGMHPLIWIVAAAGLVLIFRHPAGRDAAYFVIGLLLFSFVAVCPGLYFRAHYFVLMLPAVALLTGVAADSASRLLSSSDPAFGKVPALLFIIAFAYSVYQQGQYFFALGPDDASRANYGNSPFLASPEIGRYIDSHARPDAKILVLGSEPQIYFYSRRHSATGYIYVYSLMEDQPYARTMQEEMIRESESARPEYVIFVADPLSWVRTPRSEALIFSWADKYVNAGYALEGIADAGASGGPIYRWGNSAKASGPRTQTTIRIYKRKNG